MIAVERSDGQMVAVLEPEDTCSAERVGLLCSPFGHHYRCFYASQFWLTGGDPPRMDHGR